MQKYSSQQLVEKFKSYWIDLKKRMESKEPMTVDLGSEDDTGRRVEFDIEEVIDYGDFDDTQRFHRFEVRFNYSSSEDDDATNAVSISLDADDRKIELAMDGHLSGGYMDYVDKSPLIVSYSEQDGKSITLRPVKFDAPKMYEEEVLLAELLFNAVATKLGMIPETPFDFTPIRAYVKRYAETHDRVTSLWEDLFYDRDAVSAAWDRRLFDE